VNDKQIVSEIEIHEVILLKSDMDCYYSKFYPRREYLLQIIQNKQTNSWNTLAHS
jgi:hypothetical protein